MELIQRFTEITTDLYEAVSIPQRLLADKGSFQRVDGGLTALHSLMHRPIVDDMVFADQFAHKIFIDKDPEWLEASEKFFQILDLIFSEAKGSFIDLAKQQWGKGRGDLVEAILAQAETLLFFIFEQGYKLNFMKQRAIKALGSYELSLEDIIKWQTRFQANFIEKLNIDNGIYAEQNGAERRLFPTRIAV